MTKTSKTKVVKEKGWQTEPFPLSKPRKKQKPRLPQPYAAVKNYLEKNGWNVVVIGGTSVEQSDNFNFVFRLAFTGSKKSKSITR